MYNQNLLSENDIAVNDLVQFPGFTEYTESDCLCCKKIKIPGKKEFFLGHWEFKPFMPIVVTCLIVGLNIACIVLIDRSFTKPAEIFCDIFISFLALIYLICYFMIIIVGPGYFPFYYSGIKNNKIKEIPEDVSGVNYNPAGIISNTEQHLYATTNEKPNRSIVARSARRIVIRPDHICYWTASWIGKRNTKLFIQFNAYGSVYCLTYVILGIVSLVRYSKRGSSLMQIVFTTIFSVVACFFLIWQLTVLYDSIRNMVHGQTSWEIWNKTNPGMFDKGTKENIEDVCGRKMNLFTILCPTSPFSDKTEEELVAEYPNYYK